MADRAGFIVYTEYSSLMRRQIECHAYFHKLFWYHPDSMKDHSFFLFSCGLSWTYTWLWLKCKTVRNQGGLAENSSVARASRRYWNTKWGKFRITRSCVAQDRVQKLFPTQCLTVVTQFVYFGFRAVLKTRLFLTPETTQKLLCGFFLVEKKVLYWSVQCWKAGKLWDSHHTSIFFRRWVKSVCVYMGCGV